MLHKTNYTMFILVSRQSFQKEIRKDAIWLKQIEVSRTFTWFVWYSLSCVYTKTDDLSDGWCGLTDHPSLA